MADLGAVLTESSDRERVRVPGVGLGELSAEIDAAYNHTQSGSEVAARVWVFPTRTNNNRIV